VDDPVRNGLRATDRSGASDLNPVEGAWSAVNNGPGNLAPGTTDQLAARCATS